MKCNILIAGVGGQGTLLASRILGNYASLKGYDCKLSEVHGMAQRGGSVVTYVKMADKVYSPIIADGDADILLAFEKLEALRWAYCVRSGGDIIVNLQEIMPLPVIIGSAAYPSDIIAGLRQTDKKITEVEALKIAEAAGNVKTVNTVMIGRLAKALNLETDTLKKALEMSVPQKALEVNLKALEMSLNK